MSFEVLARDGAARRGRLSTPHGPVETPCFMPVASTGSVKGLLPQQLQEAGAGMVLSNLYHLSLRPGVEVIETLGGVHRFMGWDGPILTDSGGYQVFSLAHLRRISERGVTFRSHLDGSLVRLTPQRVVQLQERLGVDVAMVLDECPPWPVEREEASASLERTRRWAELSRAAWRGVGGLFGIAQGSVYPELRETAVEQLTALDFDGYAIGGVSVGEPPELRRKVVEVTAPALPGDRPRYLMGVGYPDDILHAVETGIDLFDCVLPARNGRHGLLFTSRGVLRVKNARFRADGGPVDAGCRCPVCQRLSRAFLHHVFRREPLTARVLATLHNVRYFLDFMGDLRQAIAAGALADLAAGFRGSEGRGKGPEAPIPEAGPAIPPTT